jgi:hypothetical protein
MEIIIVVIYSQIRLMKTKGYDFEHIFCLTVDFTALSVENYIFCMWWRVFWYKFTDALKMETMCFSETSVSFHQNTRRHTSEGSMIYIWHSLQPRRGVDVSPVNFRIVFCIRPQRLLGKSLCALHKPKIRILCDICFFFIYKKNLRGG